MKVEAMSSLGLITEDERAALFHKSTMKKAFKRKIGLIKWMTKRLHKEALRQADGKMAQDKDHDEKHQKHEGSIFCCMRRTKGCGSVFLEVQIRSNGCRPGLTEEWNVFLLIIAVVFCKISRGCSRVKWDSSLVFIIGIEDFFSPNQSAPNVEEVVKEADEGLLQ